MIKTIQIRKQNQSKEKNAGAPRGLPPYSLGACPVCVVWIFLSYLMLYASLCPIILFTFYSQAPACYFNFYCFQGSHPPPGTTRGLFSKHLEVPLYLRFGAIFGLLSLAAVGPGRWGTLGRGLVLTVPWQTCIIAAVCETQVLGCIQYSHFFSLI